MNPLLAMILRRLGFGILVLWAAYALAFLLLYALPGDSVAAVLGGDLSTASPEEIDELRHQYGFDQPLVVQYLSALGNAVRGDLGTSYTTGQPVAAAIAQALPVTVELAAWTLAIAIPGGVVLALAAVGVRSPWLRNLLSGLPSLGVSLPTFWVGLLLLQLFSFRLGVIPAIGAQGIAGVILPAVTLSLPLGAMIAQVLLRSLTQAWSRQFMTTYRAAGLGRLRLLLSHALPPAGVSLLSIAGVVLGNVLGGAVIVETVFTRNGIGRLAETSVTGQDMPVVLGVVAFSALVFVVVNLVVDLLYPVVDPRTRPTGNPPKRGRDGSQSLDSHKGPHPDAADATSVTSPPGTDNTTQSIQEARP
ncbi:ABC transporter permease [Kocuria sp. TGY1127_2]|uniref:ABC transporter permease n=1 Tax=Kocuria sp. TGY1127_2 TaxID=2711328 RepID=UPI0015BC5EB5|nr:ABC transporter permease [Kocuria sp. TGY1127_2]